MTKRLKSQKLPFWEKGKPIPNRFVTPAINENNIKHIPLDLACLLKWLKNENK
jgi:hypothetical protein